MQHYFTDLEKDQINDADQDEKIKFIKRLVDFLGGEFFQYIKNPTNYSGVGKFTPQGAGVSILFLPYDIEEMLNIGLEIQIERFLGVRIKYVEKEVEL